MLLRPSKLTVALAVALPLFAAAQASSVPSDTLLSGITMRGRLLAAYDQAAWHATDALLALHPDSETARAANIMIALKRPDTTWTVLFGRLTPASDTFYLVFDASPTARPDSFVIHNHLPPTPEVALERPAAVALQVARSDFGVQQRPYNSYVLPRFDGAFWVYFLPAQTDAAAFLHGSDVRYLISADGTRIVDKHPMHRALLNLAVPDSVEGGWHTVLEDDVPQDSDVFLVLARHPRKPELVGTAHYVYTIALDGSITWQTYDGRRNR